MHPQEQQRRPQEEPEDQAQTDEGFPGGQDEQRQVRWDDAKSQGVNSLRRQAAGRTETGKELEHSEPEKHDSQADAEQPDAVGRHPSGEGGIETVEC